MNKLWIRSAWLFTYFELLVDNYTILDYNKTKRPGMVEIGGVT